MSKDMPGWDWVKNVSKVAKDVTYNELDNRFGYHKPDSQITIDKYERIRNYAKQFADHITFETPSSREQSLALTKVEEAVFWANAAIARIDQDGNRK